MSDSDDPVEVLSQELHPTKTSNLATKSGYASDETVSTIDLNKTAKKPANNLSVAKYISRESSLAGRLEQLEKVDTPGLLKRDSKRRKFDKV